MTLHWKIDEYSAYFDRMRVRGWCVVPGAAIASVHVRIPGGGEIALRSHGLPSPDVAAAIHADGHHARFDEWIPLAANHAGEDLVLRVRLADGMELSGDSFHASAFDGDPYHACWYHFVDALATRDAGNVLEIGSRARSALSRRQFVHARHRYTGLDVLPGPNVDVVGDAHALSAIFPRGEFTAAFAISVFEHLAMPWKVVIELNRVLRPGGLVLVQTHQTFPLHDTPWDFWRFSRDAWPCLFNRATGFEIVETAYGEPARIHPLWTTPVTADTHANPAYLGSAVVARKIGETTLDWPVPTQVATAAMYPTGELTQPPIPIASPP